MTLEEQIKNTMRQSIMEEINGLGIRAAIREEIEASGITKGNINELVQKTVDSYVRSVDIVSLVDKLVDELIKKTVKEAIDKYIHYNPYTYSSTNKPKELLEEQIKKELFKQWYENYTLSVVVKEKRQCRDT